MADRLFEGIGINALADDFRKVQSGNDHATDNAAIGRYWHGGGRVSGSFLIKRPVLVRLINFLVSPSIGKVANAEQTNDEQHDTYAAKGVGRGRCCPAMQVVAVQAWFVGIGNAVGNKGLTPVS